MDVATLESKAPSLGHRSAGRLPFAARRVLAALWFGVLPALFAALVLRYLVPPLPLGGNHVLEDAVRVAQEHPVPVGVGLFLLFAGIARYWRFALPGGQYLAAPGAPDAGHIPSVPRRTYAEATALAGVLASPRVRRRLEKTLEAERLAELDMQVDHLRGGLKAGDDAAVRASAAAAREIAAPVLARHARWEVVSLVFSIALVAVVTYVVRSRLFETYGVLSGSMLPTLAPEDRLLGNRLAYRSWGGAPGARPPRRGDIIVFKSSAVDNGNQADGPEFLVKRVIGIPGDRISMHAGIPVINGWTLPFCDASEYLYVVPGGDNGLSGRLLVEYLDGRAYLTVQAAGSPPFTETYDVKPGEVFVLGDNRNNSADSRAWNDHHGGGVPFEAIEARVQWFVAGRRGDLSWDFGRLLAPIDSLATKTHVDGVNLSQMQEGIDRCLSRRPAQTQPPGPGVGAGGGKRP